MVEHPNKQSEGLRFDSFWENLDILFLSMPVLLTEKPHLSSSNTVAGLYSTAAKVS